MITFNPSALCWVLLGSHSALLGTVLFLYRILSVFFKHDGFYRFVGRVLQSSSPVLSFGSFTFPGSAFTLESCEKHLDFITDFHPQIIPFSRVFVSSSCHRHFQNILSVISQRNLGVSTEMNRKIHNSISVSSRETLTDFC